MAKTIVTCWHRLLVVGLCALQLCCTTYGLKQSASLVPKEKQEAMLAHMSVVVVLSDDSLTKAESQDVVQRGYVASGKINQFSEQIVSRFQVLMRERFGLHIRYNRDASLRVVPMDADESLLELATDGLDRNNSWFRWYYLFVYPIIPFIWLIHCAQGNQDGWTVWRHYDAQSKAFHEGDGFEGQPYAATASMLRGGDPLLGGPKNGVQETYPVYVSLGIGAVCHLRGSCTAAVRVVAIKGDGSVLLSGQGKGETGESSDPEAGILTGAVMSAFDHLLSSPQVIH